MGGGAAAWSLGVLGGGGSAGLWPREQGSSATISDTYLSLPVQLGAVGPRGCLLA